MRKLIALVFVLLAGCAATGVQVSQEAATQFKEGQTTEAQITEKLGAPTSTSIQGKVKTISYVGSQFRTNAASFIPFIGLFAGGSDYKTSVAAYQIDERGVLQKIIYSTHVGSSRMGTTPAEMQAREPSAVK